MNLSWWYCKRCMKQYRPLDWLKNWKSCLLETSTLSHRTLMSRPLAVASLTSETVTCFTRTQSTLTSVLNALGNATYTSTTNPGGNVTEQDNNMQSIGTDVECTCVFLCSCLKPYRYIQHQCRLIAYCYLVP
jgi:hypothetical protein